MSATDLDRETVAAILREHNCEDLAESPMAARIAEALAAARRGGDADTDALCDRHWIAGAQAGWNFAVADNRDGLNAAIAARRRELVAAAIARKLREGA